MYPITPVTREGADIYYTLNGSGDTTLLFVHGSNINHSYWKEQVAFFESKYKVVTIDLPGHGASGKDRPYWSIEDFADDVITIIIELKLTSVILIGHSLGSDVNLIASTKFPEHIIGFIGVDNFKNAAMPLAEAYQEKAAEILRNMQNDSAKTNEEYARMVLLTDKTPKAIVDRVIAEYRKAGKDLSLQILNQVFNSVYKTEQELLPQLFFKLYLINVDYMPTNEMLLRQYLQHGYELMHMQGTSHFPMIENSAELNKLLQKAITEITVQ